MKKIRWCELILEGSEQYKVKVQQLESFLKSKGMDPQIEFREFHKDDFLKELNKAKEDFDAIRVDQKLAFDLFKEFKEVGSDIYILQACDSLVKENGSWIPMANVKYGLEKTLSNNKKNLVLEKKALVTGNGYLSELAIFVLNQMGIRNICISNTTLEKSEEFIKLVSKFHLSANLEIIDRDRISLLKDEFFVFINTIKPKDEIQDFVEEICYYNFLSHEGLVWDFRNLSSESEFLKQSKELGYKAIGPEMLISFTDKRWLKKSFDVEIDFNEYGSVLREE